ncbi:MAG: PIN domain-containing protein [Gemmatimonas sp.]|nr:PIN domain-containing protein [Gemmatimonas sp.]
MAFIVVYEANVLVPARLRDMVMRIAESGIVRARWSDDILDEWRRALTRRFPELKGDQLRRYRSAMVNAVPDCLVSNYQGLGADLDLVDEADRHVVAAAIRAQAQLIVTYNLRHFPEHALAKYDIEVKHPDEFVLDAIDLYSGRVSSMIQQMSDNLRNPAQTVDQVLATLQGHQLTQSVAKLREQVGD